MFREDAGFNEDVPIGEEDGRSNVELFKELKRFFPTAIFDDYYKEGAWKRNHLLVDLELVQSHRSLAGVPEPPELQEEIPELAKLAALEKAKASRPRSPVRSGGRPTQPSSARPLAPTQPSGPPPKKIVEGAYEDELRRIRLFAEKWRLDHRRAKDALMALSPPQQLWVMRNYRHNTKDLGPTTELEMFIKRSQRLGDMPAPAPAPSGDRGTKRSLSGSIRDAGPSPRERDAGAPSARAPARPAAQRPRTPPRSAAPRPPARAAPRTAASPPRAPRPPPAPAAAAPRTAASRAPSSKAPAAPAGSAARSGAAAGARPRASEGLKPSPKTAPTAGTAAPARAEAKKEAAPESKPGDLIKSLLF